MKTTSLLATLMFSSALALCATGKVEASLIFSTSGNSLTLTSDAPLTFTVPTAGSSDAFFVIENAFSSPPSQDFITGNASGTITLTINGTAYTPGSGYFGGYGNITQGAFDPNDFVFGFVGSPVSFTAGDTFTLSTGTFTYTGISAPLFLPDFTTATMTLVDGAVDSLGASALVTNAVPEPSTYALMTTGAGLLLISVFRARRRGLMSSGL